MRIRGLVVSVLSLMLVAGPAAAQEYGSHQRPIEISADLGPGAATAINRPGTVAGHTGGVAWTWRDGTRTDLATIGSSASPEAINSRGDVVGSAILDGRQVGVLWSGGDVQVLDGFTTATDINDRGEIVGFGLEGALHLSRQRTTVLPDDGFGAQAHGINQRGDIVGLVRPPAGRFTTAVVWRDGKLEHLSPLPDVTDPIQAAAYDISDRGHIVGPAWEGNDGLLGFRIEPSGSISILQPGTGWAALPRAVDRYGRTAGISADEQSGGGFATVWLQGDRTLILENLVPYFEGYGASATDINDRGMVVGRATAPGTQRAVVWQLP